LNFSVWQLSIVNSFCFSYAPFVITIYLQYETSAAALQGNIARKRTRVQAIIWS